MLPIRTKGKAESIFCPTVNQLEMEKTFNQGVQVWQWEGKTGAEGDMEGGDKIRSFSKQQGSIVKSI